MYLDEIRRIALPNKYTRWYCSIVQRAMNRIRPDCAYYEAHHIIPRSFKLVDPKDPENIVVLTAKEHFVCHRLLAKMFYGVFRDKMILAAFQMAAVNVDGPRHQPSASTYEALRIAMALSKAGKPTWSKGKHNPQSAINGKKGAAKQSKTKTGKPNPYAAQCGKVGAAALAKTATGRKRQYNPDGSWTWAYPNK